MFEPLKPAEPWRPVYEAFRANIVAASPPHQFLFDREGGLLELLAALSYQAGGADALTREQERLRENIPRAETRRRRAEDAC